MDLGEINWGAAETQATIQELLGKVSSVRFVQIRYKGRELVNWSSVSIRAMKRRLHVCCSTVIFGVCNSVRLLYFLS
jgi:hypothetical protein